MKISQISTLMLRSPLKESKQYQTTDVCICSFIQPLSLHSAYFLLAEPILDSHTKRMSLKYSTEFLTIEY